MTQTRTRVKRGDYGIVEIVSGPLAGKIGYYDNEDEDDSGHTRALIYLGVPGSSRYFLVMYRDLREATPDQKIEYEMTYLACIDPEIRRQFDI